MAQAAMPLSEAIAVLRRLYGRPPPLPSRKPFELILLENVAYLASAARRREAFEQLEETIGTTPAAIVAASRAALERVTAHGILKSRFAGKLRDCAETALELGGNLDAALRGATGEARRILRKFPGIGDPAAEKILLFSGRLACLAPESNGLRVLCRLGYIPENKSYAHTYRSANAFAAQHLPARIAPLREAHLLLHRHGTDLCKRTAPLCARCPLTRGCAFALARTGASPISARLQKRSANTWSAKPSIRR